MPTGRNLASFNRAQHSQSGDASNRAKDSQPATRYNLASALQTGICSQSGDALNRAHCSQSGYASNRAKHSQPDTWYNLASHSQSGDALNRAHCFQFGDASNRAKDSHPDSWHNLASQFQTRTMLHIAITSNTFLTWRCLQSRSEFSNGHMGQATWYSLATWQTKQPGQSRAKPLLQALKPRDLRGASAKSPLQGS